MKAILGKNLGMSQMFDENGDFVPVTVISCGPNTVVQKKTTQKEGYNSLQLGMEEVKKAQGVNNAEKGHFKKAGTHLFRYLAEYRVDELPGIGVGDKIGAGVFQPGDRVNVRGTSKGRGFQGVVKRHGKKGGGAAHGSHFHRTTGSIGMNSWPSRTIKGMRMPGHMGAESVTVKNLKVVSVDVENNLIFVKGAVPGCKNGLLRVSNLTAGLGERLS